MTTLTRRRLCNAVVFAALYAASLLFFLDKKPTIYRGAMRGAAVGVTLFLVIFFFGTVLPVLISGKGWGAARSRLTDDCLGLLSTAWLRTRRRRDWPAGKGKRTHS